MKDEAMVLRSCDFRNRIFQLLFQARCELDSFNDLFCDIESYIVGLRNLK